ncbi:hypothetical protein RRG08_048522 [Elysia crispata]|uniref:Uncharacterized protein n=1 Tax=Elysia crispata TaxID=231223 RepID=A0AAE1B6W9_9GAST|nr:hypothetical protein RRG08_048522 [Elysia crispata]
MLANLNGHCSFGWRNPRSGEGHVRSAATRTSVYNIGIDGGCLALFGSQIKHTAYSNASKEKDDTDFRLRETGSGSSTAPGLVVNSH